MRLAPFCNFLLLLLLAWPGSSSAQTPQKENLKQPRILMLVDASSSMLQPWNAGLNRFQTASRIVIQLMDSIYSVNPAVEFGLRVYGHQSPAQNNDCFDSKLEVSFSKDNLAQMDLRLASIVPFGVSPIAYSLKEAALNDLLDEQRNAYSIILLTDGGESCGGNICEVVKLLLESKIHFTPYILSLVDYAPLRKQYECLGNYLQVARPDDIPKALHSIVEDYRPILSAPIMVTQLETPAKPKQQATPVLQITNLPKPAPFQRETVTALAPSGMTPLRVSLSWWPEPHYSLKQRRIQLPFIAADKEDVSALTPESSPKTLKTEGSNEPHELQSRNPNIAIKLPELPAEKKRDTVDAVKPHRDTATRTMISIKALPPVVSSTRPVAAVRPVAPKPVEATYTRETEDSKETSLAILFTNGHGKFYSTSPQLQLLDAATGKLIKQFYRTVDANGNPDPQIIPAGTYNLRVVGQSSMLMRRVLVEANKKNKLIVKVSNGSLRFEYYDAPGRPITEFEALVNIRFEPGPTIHQRCTAELEYPPGNYYIEVNTMPITRFNVDIDFGATSVVYLPQPGFVQFTNTTPKGKVQLFAPLGNQFVHFADVSITGNPGSQKLRLKPGAYEAHWVKNPELPYASETIEHFNIKSNSLTEVELH
ncbi:MAG: hypothetical protein JST06_07645 [Bacteroidetes bacterium]|nr:hypothetical protein [Bacteroidota bacterium]MBS1630911.1 hypothetical protein [Bacteroidota bacterium]